MDLEKNVQQDVRSQWVLNAPEPPSPWHVAVDSLRKTVSNYREKISSLSDQSCGTLLLSVLQVVFPILVWGRSYTIAKFRKDFLAGLTIASLCIPQVEIILLHDIFIKTTCPKVLRLFICKLIYLFICTYSSSL